MATRPQLDKNKYKNKQKDKKQKKKLTPQTTTDCAVENKHNKILPHGPF